MSKKTYNVEGIGKLTITDNDYVAAGGEATVFVKNDMAVKIYHDPNRMIPIQKIEELRQIKDPNVLIPSNIVYEGGNSPVGYVTKYIKNSNPLCKLFTKTFKSKNNISNETISDMVLKMQNTIQHIHDAKCLGVDLNEMNEIVSEKFDDVFFIDVDSYETPSFRATAIMESIRDRTIKKQHWNEGSDWYSFAIVAFQMWINIHPYKGRHPDYKPGEWIERMEKNVSVFDKNVTLPRTCEDLSVIPKSHLGWFKDVFVNGARCTPPVMKNSIAISVPSAFQFITVSKLFDVNLIETCLEEIQSVFNFVGVNYIIGKKNIHKGGAIIPIDISVANAVFMSESAGVEPVICVLKNKMAYFYNDNGFEFSKISANGMMYRNGCIYTVYDGKLTENSFSKLGNKTIHSCRHAASVMDLSTKVFNGVVIQDVLGQVYLTIPYDKGLCKNLHVNSLNGYRILDARAIKDVCVIMAEKNGKYDRFILTFHDNYDKVVERIDTDVNYVDVNLTVMPNGVAILALEDSVEIFKDNNVNRIENPPFDYTKRIYNISGVIHYIDGNKIYTAKIKK